MTLQHDDSQLANIHDSWKADSAILVTELEKAALDVPRLHAKYLNWLDVEKSSLREQEYLLSILTKKRLDWYEGLLTEEEIKQEGWDFDPFSGKLIKTKIQKEQIFKHDSVILEAKYEIEKTRQRLDTLKEILESVKWRHLVIKNIISIKQFELGL